MLALSELGARDFVEFAPVVSNFMAQSIAHLRPSLGDKLASISARRVDAVGRPSRDTTKTPLGSNNVRTRMCCGPPLMLIFHRIA
jgi:hypothetical protein